MSDNLQPANSMLDEHKRMKSKRVKQLAVLFVVALSIMIGIYVSSPSLDQHDRRVLIRFPKSPKDLSEQLEIIQRYKETNPWTVTIIWCYLYIL